MWAVAVLVAHKLRAGWRGWTALAVIVAVAGGAVLAAAAGASRTDSAYPRFLSAVQAPRTCSSRRRGTGTTGFDAAVGALPGVAASAAVVGINALPVTVVGRAGQRRRGVRLARRALRPRRSTCRSRWPAACPDRTPLEKSRSARSARSSCTCTSAACCGWRRSTANRTTCRPLTARVVGVFVTRCFRRPRDVPGPGRRRSWPARHCTASSAPTTTASTGRT